jgi:hypothetical protein
MRARVGAFVLCCLLLAPVAVAAEGEGSFTVRGKVTAPAGATVEGIPLAALAKDTAQVTAFSLRIPAGTVYAMQVREQNVAGVSLRTGYTVASWSVEDATARLLSGGDHEGFLGLYPSADGRLVAPLAAQTDSEPRAVSTISTDKAAAGDRRTTPAYYETFSRPHLLTDARGSVTYTGAGSVKVHGLDVEIAQAGGNTTRHQTGKRVSGTEETFTWLVIELRAPATLTLAGPDALTVAMPAATLAGSGVLAFTPTEGELRTTEGSYLASGAASSVEGDFRAVLAPLADGRSARMDLSGDVRPSSAFARQPAPSLLGDETPAWWGLGLLVGAVVVVGGAAYTIHKLRPRVRPMWRRAAPVEPRTVEDVRQAKRLLAYDRMLARVRAGDVERNHLSAGFYVAASKVAEAEEDWAAMYDFMRAARAGSPDVGEYVMREGFALFYKGEPTSAAGAFYDAARLLPESGEPYYWLARCLVRGGHLGEAEAALACGLGLSPEMLDDVETCADFEPLRGRPNFEAIKEAIHVRLDAEQDEKDNF